MKHPKPEKRVKAPKPIPRRAKPPARKKAPAKKRKTSLAAAKRTLWSHFAAFIKARDGNTCFTCGKEGLEGRDWHAGHMIGGRRGQVLYDPEIVRSQCLHCNLTLKGNHWEFAFRYMAQFGESKYRAHVLRARTDKQWTMPEVRELIEALKRGGADFESLYAERYVLPGLEARA